MNDNRKIPGSIMYGYGGIVAIVNYLGYLIASSGGMPVAKTRAYECWMEFMNNHNGLITFMSVMAFVIPTVLIFYYQHSNRAKLTRRFINTPFVYSIIGCLGWILSFFLEFICLLVTKAIYHISVAEIAMVSLLNILQEAICIFTLTFLILDFIHRKFVLPKVFPEGNLGKYKIKTRPSVRFLIYVFYFSVCIFPVFFLTSSIITAVRSSGTQIRTSVIVILICIMFVSVLILWMFCDYITVPIRKLKLGTQKIRDGEFGHRVDIVSNDDFGDLADAFNEMSGAIDEKNKRIQAIQNSIIRGMAVMVESRDNSTGGHINRTSDCVKIFVEKLVQTERYASLTPEFCKSVIKAAPMHDLGKIAVDDAVLRKPGKFTDEEYEKMKMHSSEGARIVESVLAQVDDKEFKQIAINVAHYHHEKWDGNGYPEKISGENIPLEARIMALADVFDALVSKRCYKDSFSYDKAFQIIEESLGSHFDPELGKVFIECRADLERLYDGYVKEQSVGKSV